MRIGKRLFLQLLTIADMISLFIPDDPIGFVKTPDQLQDVVGESFVIIETVIMKNSKFIVIFAKSKLIKGE